MKKLFAFLAALAFAGPAFAGTGEYSYYTYTGTAGSGAALTSDVIDASQLESLTIVGSVATADRDITVSCLASDSSTILFSYPAVTAASAGQAKQMIIMSPEQTVPASPATGVTYYSVDLCPKMKVVMASAAGTAQLDIIGRREQVAARVVTQQYESGSVGSGGALATPIFDTRRAGSMTIVTEATTTPRTLVVSCTDSAGTSLFDFPSLTVTAGSKFVRFFRPYTVVPGSEPTGVLHIPVHLCRYMKASIAATGVASAKLAAYIRN